MDQNRLGPLEKPLRMTDMSECKGEKKKRITKRKDPRTIEKEKTERIRAYGRIGT
jgi:hypothetical protein